MLLKQKFKCLVLSRYPHPDPLISLFQANDEKNLSIKFFANERNLLL